MRNLQSIRIPKDVTPPKLTRELEKMVEALRQLSNGVGNAVSKGNNPTAVITPDNPGLNDYFYLPGRFGGQKARGATESGGDLTLISTVNSTKGTIFLGETQASGFDEYNSRLGIGTVAPAAKLHVKGETPVSVFYRPSAVVAGVGFAQGGIAPPGSLAEVVSDGDTNFIETLAINPSTTYRLHLNANDADVTAFPTATATWVFRWQAKKVLASAVTHRWDILDALGVSVVSGTLEAATTSYTPSRTVSLTLAQAQQIKAAGTFLQFTVDTFAGLGPFSTTNQWRLTWMELEVPSGTGAGLGGQTAIFDTGSSASADNTQWRSSAGTVLVDITAAGRLTVESGGSFRHVPGAAASTLFKGDANGDASWGTVTLLSAYHSDTLAAAVTRGALIVGNATPKWSSLTVGGASTLLKSDGTDVSWGTVNLLSAFHADTLAASVVRGDVLIGNSTPKWARLAIGSNGKVLTSDGTDISWQTPASPTNALLDGANHTDTVAQTVSRGSLIYGNATPKWDELVIGSANTVLRADGTDASWGAIDHNYISNRTRTFHFHPSTMVSAGAASSTLTFTGTWPNNYHLWTMATSAGLGSNKGVEVSFSVPADWVSGTDMTIYAYTTKAAGGVDVNGYEVNSSYISRASTESLVTAVTTNTSTNVPSVTASSLDIRAIGTIAAATLAAGEHLKLNVYRDTDFEITNAGSSTNNTMGLVGIRIDYTAVM